MDIEVGGRRTGLADEDRIVALAQQIADAANLEYAGVQGYVGDHQNTVDYDLRRARSRELLEPLVRIVERLARRASRHGSFRVEARARTTSITSSAF